jgi:hypothetical protein
MEAAGCSTLACLKAMSGEEVLHKFQGSKQCSLTRYQDMKEGIPGFPYDGETVPNMMEASCKQNLASAHIPVVVGHSKNELDSLKFQFPDLEGGSKKFYDNVVPYGSQLVGASLIESNGASLIESNGASLIESNASSKQAMEQSAKKAIEAVASEAPIGPATHSCVVEKLLAQQAGQEKMEDVGFNMGSYMFATRKTPNAGPRWHFTIHAPTSATGRSWHTTPEIMVWNATKTKSSNLYSSVTKAYVTGNASPELSEYLASNFQHFVKTGEVMDANWPQTSTVAADQLGGLPSVDLSNGPNVATVVDHYHHHHESVKAVHCLTCNHALPKGESDGLNLQSCVTNPQADGGLTEQEKSAFKEKQNQGHLRDFDFLKAFMPFTQSSMSTFARAVTHDKVAKE